MMKNITMKNIISKHKGRTKRDKLTLPTNPYDDIMPRMARADLELLKTKVRKREGIIKLLK